MRLKTLNGAPLCERLDFNEKTLLPTEDCNIFQAAVRSSTYIVQSTPVTKWRSLTKTDDTRLHTGWSQPYLPGRNSPRDELNLSNLYQNVTGPLDLTDNDISILDTTVTFGEPSLGADDFLQHSFIFHDTLLSSQILPKAGIDDSVASASFMTTSFGTSMSECNSSGRVSDGSSILQVPSDMDILPLGSLPSPQHLRSIYPQTPTPNLLCVLVNSPVQREISIRKSGYTMNLWELTVADDTRAGFKVSFWLRPPRGSTNEQTHAQNVLLQTLRRTRIGDILLLRNIALTSFRETVYGQSLKPAITRARTSIDILKSSSGLSAAQLGGLPAPIIEAFMRVKRWAETHVDSNSTETKKRRGSATHRDKHDKRPFAIEDNDEYLPPDTMESV